MASKASALRTNSTIISKTDNDKKPPKAKALDFKNRLKLKLWTPKNA
jgi:hypothetical protein